jgi:hypothetical protein
MSTKTLACAFGFLLCMAGLAQAQNVRIVEPKDGSTVSSPFVVKLEVKGMKVGAAGATEPGVGHHHILINQEVVPKGEEIPFTRRHIHLNKGQSESSVTLPPGTYKLTALFGDGVHKSLGPDYSQTISITVK